MALSMYQASVPVFTRGLTSLAAILRKGESHASAHGMDAAALTAARLAPDMHPLTRQVQIASDAAKGSVARLAQLEVPSFPDTETNFAELHARIEKTLSFIGGVDAALFEGSEDRVITVKFRQQDVSMPGAAFLFGFSLPNFYFHLTTAYGILRHNGVALAKADFLGA